jgi:hypothetical protein
MKGGRQLFTCPACGKSFFYWVPEAVSQPKVKCYFCNGETFPNGEPPVPPAPVPAPPAPKPAVAAPPAEGTPTPAT